MRKAHDAVGEHFSGTTADQVSIELHASTSPYGVVATLSNVNLSTSGIITATVPESYSGSYYLVIRHRNSIETWSAAPISFSGSSISYNFTNFASKAYGNNLKPISGSYARFGGDIIQDGIIDSQDLIPVDNNSALFKSGYLDTDVNGDGAINILDLNIINSNAAGFVGVKKP